MAMKLAYIPQHAAGHLWTPESLSPCWCLRAFCTSPIYSSSLYIFIMNIVHKVYDSTLNMVTVIENNVPVGVILKHFYFADIYMY